MLLYRIRTYYRLLFVLHLLVSTEQQETTINLSVHANELYLTGKSYAARLINNYPDHYANSVSPKEFCVPKSRAQLCKTHRNAKSSDAEVYKFTV